MNGYFRDPIFHSGNTVYNATRDATDVNRRLNSNNGTLKNRWVYKDNAAFNDLEKMALSIHPGDVCVLDPYFLVAGISPKLVNDTDQRVMSCCNRLLLNKQPSQYKEYTSLTGTTNKDVQRRYMLLKLEELKFAGIARNRAEYDEFDRHHEKNFALQVGGLTTIKNNTANALYAGDFLYWDLPEDNGRHIAALFEIKGKYPYTVQAFNVAEYYNIMEASLGDAPDGEKADDMRARCTTPGLADRYADLSCAEIVRAESFRKLRIFGRIMQSSKPKQGFHVLLGSYCV